MKKIALVTGITGQDGSYLTELLLSKGYEIHGIIRRASTFNTGRIDHLLGDPRLHLHYGDMSDGTGLRRILEIARPDEVYNLAAMSHVRVSYDQPKYTADVVGIGTLRLLDAVRDMKAPIRLYQASSSEQFGNALPMQSENTPFAPVSPYGVAKVFAHQIAVMHREAYGMFVTCGILFNHESPRRAETFVTRKITRAVTRIALGLQNTLRLGNLDAYRDWGHAKDYVQAMWLMLQQEKSDDYVIATGKTHTVREFLTAAFHEVGIQDWKRYVAYDERYVRPVEVEALCGNVEKASRKFRWSHTIGMTELVREMVAADMVLAEREKSLKEMGHA